MAVVCDMSLLRGLSRPCLAETIGRRLQALYRREQLCLTLFLLAPQKSCKSNKAKWLQIQNWSIRNFALSGSAQSDTFLFPRFLMLYPLSFCKYDSRNSKFIALLSDPGSGIPRVRSMGPDVAKICKYAQISKSAQGIFCSP